MRKILALLLALTLCFGIVGCSPQQANTDWKYIANKGEMIIGITYFSPMNFKDDSGNLTGFETEFAQAVCEKLGVKAKFQEIDWSAKETELNSKNIDCIWNGMTITDERKANMDISIPYMKNKQVMVAKNGYILPADITGLSVIAEKGSAGEGVAKEDAFFSKAKYTAVDSQAKVLLEIKSGTADVGLIDYVMTVGSIGEGTDYTDLSIIADKDFAPEEYGIAFRKGSPITMEKINAAIKELAKDGTLAKIAAKYKLTDLILVK